MGNSTFPSNPCMITIFTHDLFPCIITHMNTQLHLIFTFVCYQCELNFQGNGNNDFPVTLELNFYLFCGLVHEW